MKSSSEIRHWRRSQREALQQRRLALGQEERRQKAERVIAFLQAHVPELRGASIGFYWPFRGEMDLRGLATALHAEGARLSLPVVVETGEPLEFWHWEPRAKLARGVWRIPVPAERVVVDPAVLIVPLLGFDPAGYRLGYGGGYYDRTLAVMHPRPFTVGVGYEVGRLRTIYPQDHDIPMDAIATESGFARFDAGRRVIATAKPEVAGEAPPEESRSDGHSAVASAADLRRLQEEKLDEALKGTFPASDPFSLA